MRVEVKAACIRCGCDLSEVGEFPNAITLLAKRHDLSPDLIEVAIVCSDSVACDERVVREFRVDELLRDYRRRHGLPEPILGNN